jgi:hypothetical protein
MILMNFLKINLLFISVLFFAGCSNLKPFPDKKYSVPNDYFFKVYEQELVYTGGEEFDSNQVSNKYLDPEMISALQYANSIIANPDKLMSEIAPEIKALGLNKITIASASRSPWFQYRLSSKYKAKYLNSFHMLGLAVDLEMKGKSFDFRENPAKLKNYYTLEKVLNKAGMVFSEPKEVDANHVELFKYCKKKNPNYKKFELQKKEQHLIACFISQIEAKLKYEKKSRNKTHLKTLLTDLNSKL